MLRVVLLGCLILLTGAVDSVAGEPQGGNRRPGGETSTTLFGTSGSGSKFIYVFDRSASMAELNGRPLAAAKRELIASLQHLDETTQFQIIFYNQRPRIFHFRSQSPRLVWANEEGKQAATQFVEAISASGGTEHMQALKLALGLQPDVVFFLTDADEPQLTEADLQQIDRWNQGSRINAIEFGIGPQSVSEGFLQRLASRHRGQHVYVDVASCRGRCFGAFHAPYANRTTAPPRQRRKPAAVRNSSAPCSSMPRHVPCNRPS
jgi:hypothetical protein